MRSRGLSSIGVLIGENVRKVNDFKLFWDNPTHVLEAVDMVKKESK